MKLVQFIICDDIRMETGNKFSLMGIYENTIEFRVTPDKKDKWPKTMRLGIYAKVIFDKDEDTRIFDRFKARMEFNGKPVKFGGGTINIPPKAKTMNIVMVNPNTAFAGPGELTFVLDFFNEAGDRIETLSPEFQYEIKEKVMESSS